MAVSRFSNSRIGAGFPKYQTFWDQTTTLTISTEVLVIAGGGAGGSGNKYYGGGGAGGYRTNNALTLSKNI